MEELDSETKFLQGLIEIQYTNKFNQELIKVAQHVNWAKGWPEDKEAFWNAEAFMWSRKISKEKRELINKELLFLDKGRNLDLGCGAYSYIKSVGFDFSGKMLQFNDNLVKKVKGNLEKKLPFKENSFDSVTAIFVLNYVENYDSLLGEIMRILNNHGKFVMILFSKSVNEWQKQKELNLLSASKWKEILIMNGFSVEFYEKEKLWFFKCSN
tara:strand:- start:2366 stop:3001 length:636 start_codon:yes stop_codon:yes gene_type:complete